MFFRAFTLLHRKPFSIQEDSTQCADMNDGLCCGQAPRSDLVEQQKGDAMSKSSAIKGFGLSRQDLLRTSAAAAFGAAVSEPGHALGTIEHGANLKPGDLSTPRSAIAKTQYGKVRGFLDGGVFTFKGIPYGQTTAGENRWLPA